MRQPLRRLADGDRTARQRDHRGAEADQRRQVEEHRHRDQDEGRRIAAEDVAGAPVDPAEDASEHVARHHRGSGNPPAAGAVALRQ